MTRQQLSEWWAIRGNAWDAVATLERELLNLLRSSQTESMHVNVRDALGCVRAAQGLVAVATELAHREAEKLSDAATPEPRP